MRQKEKKRKENCKVAYEHKRENGKLDDHTIQKFTRFKERISNWQQEFCLN